MTTKLKEGPSLNKEELENTVKFNPSDYSCELILENTTLEKANDKKFPTDAFNIVYLVNDEKRLDVIRSSKMVNVFNFYCDKYGKNSVQSIDYGYGSVSPGLWGNSKPTPKKRKRNP